MTPLTFMEAIARVLPPDVAVIEEAVTTTSTMFERLGALKNTPAILATAVGRWVGDWAARSA